MLPRLRGRGESEAFVRVLAVLCRFTTTGHLGRFPANTPQRERPTYSSTRRLKKGRDHVAPASCFVCWLRYPWAANASSLFHAAYTASRASSSGTMRVVAHSNRAANMRSVGVL